MFPPTFRDSPPLPTRTRFSRTEKAAWVKDTCYPLFSVQEPKVRLLRNLRKLSTGDAQPSSTTNPSNRRQAPFSVAAKPDATFRNSILGNIIFTPFVLKLTPYTLLFHDICHIQKNTCAAIHYAAGAAGNQIPFFYPKKKKTN